MKDSITSTIRHFIFSDETNELGGRRLIQDFRFYFQSHPVPQHKTFCEIDDETDDEIDDETDNEIDDEIDNEIDNEIDY